MAHNNAIAATIQIVLNLIASCYSLPPLGDEIIYNMIDSTNKNSEKPLTFHDKLRATQFWKALRWLKKTTLPRLGTLHQYSPKPFSTMPAHYKNMIELKSPPLISIVTPSFNQGHFLEKTIESVLRQDYPNLEYIIQDGGSTDESVSIIKRYQSSLKHWESKRDQGQSHALNLGFQHATGEIMAYLNSDDLLMGGSLHYIAQYFIDHPDVDVVYGHRIIINEKDQEIGRWVLAPHNSHALTYADFIPQETLFWRRRIWEKAGGRIDESFRFAMDWDLILRFMKAGAKFARLPRFLGAFRVHTEQKTSATMSSIGEEEIARLRLREHGKLVSTREVKRNVYFYLLQHLALHNLYRLGLLRY